MVFLPDFWLISGDTRYIHLYMFLQQMKEKEGRSEFTVSRVGLRQIQQHLTFTYKGITIHNLTLAADNLNTAHPHTAEIGIRREVSE